MNLHQLDLFCTTVERGSFALASRQLYISQPALSIQVKRLERSLGVELLRRFLDYTDLNTCVVFGVGAGAVLVSAAAARGGLLGLDMYRDGWGTEGIIFRAGGPAEASPYRQQAHTNRVTPGTAPGGSGNLTLQS